MHKLLTVLIALASIAYVAVLAPRVASAGCISLLGAGKNCGASIGGGTTWNPADAAASISFSADHLTATDSSNTNASYRAVASHSSGKFYAEFTMIFPTYATLGLGIANSSAPLGNFPGLDTNSVGYVTNSGDVYLNNSHIAGFNGTTDPISGFGNGTIIGMAVDLSAKLIWYRGGSANWNNNAAANPATGVGGLDISGLAAGPYFVIGFAAATGDGLTANFGASAYTQTPPSGFGNW